MSQAEATRAESIEEQERERAGDKKPKSRRPASSHPLTQPSLELLDLD
jgi:hypothetical protein